AVTATNAAGSATASSGQTAAVTQGPNLLTLSETASADDGDVQVTASTSGGYPPAGTASVSTNGAIMTAGRRNAYGVCQVLAALLRFDLSGLPSNATVQSATLKLAAAASSNADSRSLVAEWVPSSDWPIAPSDYAVTSTANALSGVPVSSITVGS